MITKGFLNILVNITLIISFIIVLLTLSCGGPTFEEAEAVKGIKIEREQYKPGADIYLMIDESRSMFGSQGNDALGLRHKAARYFFQNLLIKDSDAKYPNRISVIHFGDKPIASPLIDLTVKYAEKIKNQIISVPPQEATNFIAALEKIEETEDSAPIYYNRRSKSIIIFTDGRPWDKKQLSINDYFSQIKAIVQKKDGRLGRFNFFIIGIDTTGQDYQKTVGQWNEIAGASNVFRITNMEDLYAQFNNVIRKIFEFGSTKEDLVATDQEFEVEPYLDKIEFHVFTQLGLSLAIFNPGGLLVDKDMKNVSISEGEQYTIITVKDPEPGQWRYKITEGEGIIKVFRNPIPFKLQLMNPKIMPLGREIEVMALFARDDGKEIIELPQYPLNFAAQVTKPDGEEMNLDLRKIRQSLYIGEPIIKSEQEGIYKIKLIVKGGIKLDAISTFDIEVVSYPYLEINLPAHRSTQHYDKRLNLQVEIKEASKTVDVRKLFSDHPDQMILAQLHRVDKEEEYPVYWLKFNEAENKYLSSLPIKMHERGLYILDVQLKGNLRVNNEKMPESDLVSSEFSVKPSFFQSILEGGQIILLIILIIIASWLLLIIIWLLKGYSMRGTLSIQGPLSDIIESYNLSRKRFLFPKNYDYEVVDSENIAGANSKVSKSFTFFIRGKNADRIIVYKGGWGALIFLGLFASKYTLSRQDMIEIQDIRFEFF